jgi:glucosamine--fructose-6-phosphate aminotransferase (isomerizing)
LSIVHNGIIENYLTLKTELVEKGYRFNSDTDTEVLLYLIHDYYSKTTGDVYTATKLALERVVGAYAFILMNSQDNILVCGRKGSPLAIGEYEGDFHIASDPSAFSDHVENVVYPEDNSVIKIDKKIEVYNMTKQSLTYCNIQKLHRQLFKIEKGEYEHFMKKEIFEQSKCLDDAVRGRIDGYNIKLGGLLGHEKMFANTDHITIIACGTSWNAGLIAKYYIEEFCDIKVSVEYASEFRYRQPFLQAGDIVIGISQSGETADTLAALSLAKERGAFIVGICNVVNSSLSRMTNCGVYLRAGMEIGVASTKAFTSQVVCLLLLSLWIEQNRGSEGLETKKRTELVSEIKNISNGISRVLELVDKKTQLIAQDLKDKTKFMFMGRKFNYPVALEGALKMKELCYNFAEGFAAAELKHGPMALVDENTIVVAINNDSSEEQMLKMANNIKEVKARGAYVIAIDCWGSITGDCDESIKISKSNSYLSPIFSVIPLQLLAYYSAIFRDKNVDRPRNLAKSVTVE